MSPTRISAPLGDRVTAWRARAADLERRARARLRAEESVNVADPRRKPVSLGDEWRSFWGHPSPWLVATALFGALVARVIVGDWRSGDALVPVVMIAAFPLVEWIIHVFLHWRPRTLVGYTIDPLLARKHREHHADPRDVPLVFVPWQVLLWLLPLNIAIAVVAFPRMGLGLTFLVVLFALGFGYEWTHYLIHSDYRPRTRLYRAIWRNHRLHHYKNEHYWFTVTTSGTADRILGTFPDPQRVATSPTAKNLHGQ